MTPAAHLFWHKDLRRFSLWSYAVLGFSLLGYILRNGPDVLGLLIFPVCILVFVAGFSRLALSFLGRSVTLPVLHLAGPVGPVLVWSEDLPALHGFKGEIMRRQGKEPEGVAAPAPEAYRDTPLPRRQRPVRFERVPAPASEKTLHGARPPGEPSRPPEVGMAFRREDISGSARPELPRSAGRHPETPQLQASDLRSATAPPAVPMAFRREVVSARGTVSPQALVADIAGPEADAVPPPPVPPQIADEARRERAADRQARGGAAALQHLETASPHVDTPGSPVVSDTVPETGPKSPVVPERAHPAYPFDLFLLDCDDTLVFTAPLEAFRKEDGPYEGPAWEAALRHTQVAPGLREWLDTLSALPDRPRLVVFSRARRAYLEALLSHHFPDGPFDQVLGYEDARAVQAFKPDPRLALHVLRQYRVLPSRTAVMGDHPTDVQLAHTLGAVSLLTDFYASRRKPRDWTFLDALDVQPHQVIRQATDLQRALPLTAAYDLPLEALGHGVEPYALRRPLTDMRYLCFESKEYRGPRLPVTFLGRYYTRSRHGDADRHRLPLADRHLLSEQILAKESGSDHVPKRWVDAVLYALRLLGQDQRSPLVLTAVPSKAGRPRRMERLLRAVADLDPSNVLVEPSAFVFGEGAPSLKPLRESERAEAQRTYLHVHPDFRARQEYTYVILDDVVTTGSTLKRARDLLVEAGVPARRVQALALARTLSVRRRS